MGGWDGDTTEGMSVCHGVLAGAIAARRLLVVAARRACPLRWRETIFPCERDLTQKGDGRHRLFLLVKKYERRRGEEWRKKMHEHAITAEDLMMVPAGDRRLSRVAGDKAVGERS